ncbi:MAG: SpoIVB peptidase [Firmicutes bacterium]|nr:SpoIVB peptidase [Bacillota bacterium]
MGGSRTRIIVAFAMLIIISSGLLLLVSFLNTPIHMRLLPGQDQPLQVLPLFTVRDLTGSKELLIRTDDGITLRPQALGRVDLQLWFMDVIPLRQMVVDVVPQVYVRPGGQAIGVLLSTRGLIVSRTFPLIGVDGREYHPAREAGILPGDIIEEISGQPVRSIQHVSILVDRMGQAQTDIIFSVKRGSERFTVKIRPIPVQPSASPEETGIRYMLGLVLEEPTAGVGTLTFYHPSSRRYGALGHLIAAQASSPVHVEDGQIVRAQIMEIRRGLRGSPGEKKGTFRSERDAIGSIEKNTKFGIFGRLTADVVASPWDREIPVALAANVRLGPAQILTVLDGEQVESFNVEIVKVTPQSRPDDKGIVVKVTDERLLSRTGGIIQGMSGSPILQDGALVGAVTHVFVNDPERGFGIFAEWMLQEAGLWENKNPKTAAKLLQIPMAS